MIILYVLLVAYILAINFYAFLLVKSLRDKSSDERLQSCKNAQTHFEEGDKPVKGEKTTSKLLITGLLGGAIAVYVSMFLLKYKRGDLLLMVLMPLLGVLNVYVFVLLFRSGFSFFVV